MEDLCCKIRGRVAHVLKELANHEHWEEVFNKQNTKKQVPQQLGRAGPLYQWTGGLVEQLAGVCLISVLGQWPSAQPKIPFFLLYIRSDAESMYWG